MSGNENPKAGRNPGYAATDRAREAAATPAACEPAATSAVPIRHRPAAAPPLVLALALLAFAAAPASALTDHLECFKVKDSMRARATMALAPDAAAQAAGFAARDCQARIKAAELCIPVEKTLVDADGPTLPVSGPARSGALLCYKIKCKQSEPAAIDASDQLGTRALAKPKAARLCTPTDY